MSVCNLPRIHFSGTAFLNAPTGCRNHYPLVDLSTNSVLYDGKAVERQIPAPEYHAYLDEMGERIDHNGHFNPDGPFNLAKGWGFGVNGHFLVDARIHHTQLQPAHSADNSIEQNDNATVDSLVGSKIEFWGHHNEYLGTTFNRARVFDGDPTSYWTRQLMLGRVTFGRRQESHKTPNAFSGSVNCTAHARWQRRDFLHGLAASPIQHLLGGSELYQLTIDKESDQLLWMDNYPESPVLLALKAAMSAPTVRGLVLQFTISQLQLPAKPDTPIPHKINGTISPWHVDELSTYPAGRLLIPQSRTVAQNSAGQNSETPTVGALTCQLFSDRMTLNAFSAFPRRWNGADRTVVETVDFGPLDICCTQSGLPVAQIPREAYSLAALEKSSGIIDLPLLGTDDATLAMIAAEGLLIRQADADHAPLLQEQEINVQTEDANATLETACDDALAESHQFECRQQVKIVSFVRGVRQSVSHITLTQQHNPNALAAADQPLNRPVASLSESEISTDEKGESIVSLRGIEAGTARIHFHVKSDTVQTSYDNEDALRYWGSQGCLYVRTLPDAWHLLSIDDAAIDFDLIYKEIFYFYELTSSFMRHEVFSLQDSFKVETYRRLIWQMSDPDNRDKTYYMPPTRDLSYPKAILLYKYLQNHERAGFIPTAAKREIPTMDSAGIAGTQATSPLEIDRATLVKALRDAADLEILVMQQYLYAAYSIPNYKTGLDYVEQGLWTPEQLLLLCGDGVEKQNFGLRGTLLEIAREEMIHFLVVNNLLMAIGEDFYAAAPEIYEVNAKFAMGITFGLEPFSLAQLEKFIELERPFVIEDLHLAEQLPVTEGQQQAPYRSISQLYQQIADLVTRRPEFFVPRGDAVGGEHHLYLSEKLDAHHPDYQIQVYDVESALFAINFITEQGEGGTGDFVEPEESHYRRFKEMFYILASEDTRRYQADPAAQPWSPAYPCVRNPTLLAGTEGCALITDPTARELTSIFQNSYWLMLVIMNQHFGLMPNHTLRRSRLMNASIDVMTGILRPLGELIMTVPSGQLGHTAGISFQLPRPVVFIPEPERAYQTIAEQFALEERRARLLKEVPEAVVGMLGFYQAFFQDFADDPAKALS